MPNRYHAQTGEQALTGLTNHLAKTSQTLRAHMRRDDLPPDYRRRVRNEAVADAKAAVDEARQAFAAWASRRISEARATLASDKPGTAADETRRLRREMETQRLIDTARLADERTGVSVEAGRVVKSPAAQALAAKASQLYLDGAYDSAVAHATAAKALGVDVAKVLDAAQGMVDMDDPDKKAAHRDLDAIGRAEAIFVRDSSAALADALQAAADEAADQGDDPGIFRKAAVGPSMNAKAAAMAIARLDGKDYEPPIGAMASTPSGPATQS